MRLSAAVTATFTAVVTASVSVATAGRGAHDLALVLALAHTFRVVVKLIIAVYVRFSNLDFIIVRHVVERAPLSRRQALSARERLLL